MQSQVLNPVEIAPGKRSSWAPRSPRASAGNRWTEPGAVHFILNPTAGGGRAARLRGSLAREVERHFGVVSSYVTSAPGEATRSAREAIERGARLVLVAGGDGTIQEAVNGFFDGDRPLNPDCELGVLSCGTGRGLAGSVGLPDSLEEQLERIIAAPVHFLDVGRVRYTTSTGQRGQRLFINECQGALGGAVVRTVGLGHKLLGGSLAFGVAAVSQLLRCRSAWLRVTLDGRTSLEGSFLALMVGNGEQCGGGMKLLPGARPDDGWLDVVLVGALTVPERLVAFPRIYRGLHTTLAQVRAFRCRRLTVEGATNVPLEADGELLGGLPCEIDVLPGVLPMRGTGLFGTHIVGRS